MNAVYRTLNNAYHGSLTVAVNATATDTIGDLASDVRKRCWLVLIFFFLNNLVTVIFILNNSDSFHI